MKKKSPIGCSLDCILETLHALAPLELAGSWDNVGLLMGPLKPRKIKNVFLTIDLTDTVMDEALETRADLIVAYHPPLFIPFNRIDPAHEKARVILKIARANIALYSPHSALDTVEGGVADWLADGLGDGRRNPLSDVADAETGPGRLVTLGKSVTLQTLARRIKSHLALKHLRVASVDAHQKIRTIALCPGAGTTVVQHAAADLVLTGEMKHHDVLAANAHGTSVILTEHTNCERGYLPLFKRFLTSALGDAVRVTVSQLDRDPLSIA